MSWVEKWYLKRAKNTFSTRANRTNELFVCKRLLLLCDFDWLFLNQLNLHLTLKKVMAEHSREEKRRVRYSLHLCASRKNKSKRKICLWQRVCRESLYNSPCIFQYLLVPIELEQVKSRVSPSHSVSLKATAFSCTMQLMITCTVMSYVWHSFNCRLNLFSTAVIALSFRGRCLLLLLSSSFA